MGNFIEAPFKVSYLPDIVSGELIVTHCTTEEDKCWVLSEPLTEPACVSSIRQQLLVTGQLH